MKKLKLTLGLVFSFLIIFSWTALAKDYNMGDATEEFLAQMPSSNMSATFDYQSDMWILKPSFTGIKYDNSTVSEVELIENNGYRIHLDSNNEVNYISITCNEFGIIFEEKDVYGDEIRLPFEKFQPNEEGKCDFYVEHTYIHLWEGYVVYRQTSNIETLDYNEIASQREKFIDNSIENNGVTGDDEITLNDDSDNNSDKSPFGTVAIFTVGAIGSYFALRKINKKKNKQKNIQKDAANIEDLKIIEDLSYTDYNNDMEISDSTTENKIDEFMSLNKKEKIRIRNEYNQDQSSYYDTVDKMYGYSTNIAKGIEIGCDSSIDFLENITGPAGKMVKNVYTVSKKTLVGTSEYLHSNDKSFSNAVDKIGANFVEGMTDVAEGYTEGKYKGAKHIFTYVKDAVKTGYKDGFTLENMGKSFEKSSKNVAFDIVSDGISDKLPSYNGGKKDGINISNNSLDYINKKIKGNNKTSRQIRNTIKKHFYKNTKGQVQKGINTVIKGGLNL
ncbi:hypothetical protein [Clostridium sp. DL1XJH146]